MQHLAIVRSLSTQDNSHSAGVARIQRGEDISTRREDRDAAAEAIAAAGEFFDPEAQHDEPATGDEQNTEEK